MFWGETIIVTSHLIRPLHPKELLMALNMYYHKLGLKSFKQWNFVLCRICLCALACGFCIRRKGRTGGGGWGHPQGAVHMVAARLGYKQAMVGT